MQSGALIAAPQPSERLDGEGTLADERRFDSGRLGERAAMRSSPRQLARAGHVRSVTSSDSTGPSRVEARALGALSRAPAS